MGIKCLIWAQTAHGFSLLHKNQTATLKKFIYLQRNWRERDPRMLMGNHALAWGRILQLTGFLILGLFVVQSNRTPLTVLYHLASLLIAPPILHPTHHFFDREVFDFLIKVHIKKWQVETLVASFLLYKYIMDQVFTIYGTCVHFY